MKHEIIPEGASEQEIREAGERLKERIYSAVTLIALLATLWHTADHHTPQGVAASIIGATTALWLAVAISTRISYQVVHGKTMPAREVGNILAIRRSMLVPAIPPLFFIALSALSLMSLKTALLISMITTLLSFALLSLRTGRAIHSSTKEIIISSTLEIGLGIGVILLKIAAGH